MMTIKAVHAAGDDIEHSGVVSIHNQKKKHEWNVIDWAQPNQKAFEQKER